MADLKAFDPKDHMRVFERRQRQLDGSYQTVRVDYLDVKWRVVWFRESHPNGTIETELLTAPGVSPAVVKATVSFFDEGGTEVVATGHGQCGQDDWSDWLEKAETRAIGRALALLGYGTQFASDEFDDAVAGASTPVPARPPANRSKPAGGETGEVMTPNQQKYIHSLAKDAGVPKDELEEIVNQRFGRGLNDLLKSEASALIDSLTALRDERKGDGTPAAAANGADAGLITDRQMKAIERLQKKQQMGDRDLIAYAGNLVERQIASLVELTEDEAGEVIKALGAL